MKSLFTLLASLVLLTAHAEQVFTSYEDYYRQLPGAFFVEALNEPSEPYAIKKYHGFCGEEDSCEDYRGRFGSKKITVTVSLNTGKFQVNGRRFSYQKAQPLGSVQNTSEEIPLYGISVYMAQKMKSHPDMLCIEGYYMGSGRFRNTQVFLVVNPLGSSKQTKFFHLPSLHSSCLAVRQESNGAIGYLSNSYIPNGDAEKSTGLLLKYFALKVGVSYPLNQETRLRFLEVGKPFQFSVE